MKYKFLFSTLLGIGIGFGLSLHILALKSVKGSGAAKAPSVDVDRLSSISIAQQRQLYPSAHNANTWIEDLTLESEEIWRASIAKRLVALQQFESFFQATPWGQTSYVHIWDFFTPGYNCPRSVERVGRPGDGGKWVCAFTHIVKTKKNCVVYSYGIGGEITFEKEILERSNCTLRMYDHTISATAGPAPDLVNKYPSQAKLYSYGLGINNTENLRTLLSEMKKHGDSFIDILKIDIEGWEFATIRTILNDFPSTLPFGQLQVELHCPQLPNDNKFFKQLTEWINLLEASGLRIFFVEPNQLPMLIGQHKAIFYYEFGFLNSKIGSTYFV